MGVEIEHKFLVSGEYKQYASSSSHIRQGYICSGGGRTVRVRIRDEKGYLTIKGPSLNGGLSRYEFETEIAPDDAEDLMKLCEKGIIDKRRYLVPYEGHTYEVDEFYGDNEGLTMAEVELRSESEPFAKPAFIGRDVTGDRRFTNSSLRLYPFPLWKDTLPEYGGSFEKKESKDSGNGAIF